MVYCAAMFMTHRKGRNAAQRAVSRLLGAMRCIRRLLLPLAATFVLGVVIGPATAQQPRTTRHGAPPAEYIATRFGDVLQHAPTRYVGSSASTRKWMAERPRLGFSFWMPDRRPTEKPLYGQPPFRPQEEGRPRPPHDAHIVGVTLTPADRNDPTYVSPERMRRNLTSHAGPSSYSEQTEPFGLLRFWRNNLPVGEREADLHFRTADGADPAVLLRCTAWHRTEIASCRAEIHYGTEKVHAMINFAREYLPQWRAIVTAVIELYQSWKVIEPR